MLSLASFFSSSLVHSFPPSAREDRKGTHKNQSKVCCVTVYFISKYNRPFSPLQQLHRSPSFEAFKPSQIFHLLSEKKTETILCMAKSSCLVVDPFFFKFFSSLLLLFLQQSFSTGVLVKYAQKNPWLFMIHAGYKKDFFLGR